MESYRGIPSNGLGCHLEWIDQSNPNVQGVGGAYWKSERKRSQEERYVALCSEHDEAGT